MAVSGGAVVVVWERFDVCRAGQCRAVHGSRVAARAGEGSGARGCDVTLKQEYWEYWLVLQRQTRCYNASVTTPVQVLQRCYNGCYNGVLQHQYRCYNGVTTVLQRCYNNVRVMYFQITSDF